MKTTPPLHAEGRYTLRLPWVASPTTIYSCIAIRSFADIFKLGKNVLADYYAPKNLTSLEYEADSAEGAHIVTLLSREGEVIYVPDTYIESYPNMNNVAYSHVVLSVSIGALPDYIDLTFLRQQLSAVTSDVIGVAPTVKENRAPSVGAIDPLQHENLEVSRLAAITNRTTDFAKLKIELAKNQTLLEKVAMLEKIIRDKNLLN